MKKNVANPKKLAVKTFFHTIRPFFLKKNDFIEKSSESAIPANENIYKRKFHNDTSYIVKYLILLMIKENPTINAMVIVPRNHLGSRPHHVLRLRFCHNLPCLSIFVIKCLRSVKPNCRRISKSTFFFINRKINQYNNDMNLICDNG